MLMILLCTLSRCWGGGYSLLNCIGALTLSLLLKLPLRKLEPWFVPWSFFLLRFFCTSINLSYRLAWNCCHVWASACNCYLKLLDQLQKQICRTIGPSLAVPLEPLAHCQNVATLSLFYRFYIGTCSSEPAKLIPLPFSQGRLTHYSDRLHDFSDTIPRCCTDVYVNSFFPCRARLWNSLPIKCFPLTHDLNGFCLELTDHY